MASYTEEDLLALSAGRTDKQIADEVRRLAEPAKTGKGGRPRKVINYDQVHRMAELGCNISAIAASQHISRRTMLSRMAEDDELKAAVTYGKLRGEAKLQQKMHEMAVAGNLRALIWSLEQRLGQSRHGKVPAAGADRPTEECQQDYDYSRLTEEERRQLDILRCKLSGTGHEGS